MGSIIIMDNGQRRLLIEFVLLPILLLRSNLKDDHNNCTTLNL